jgi:acetyl-CoA carboxylase carboxyltransferase component
LTLALRPFHQIVDDGDFLELQPNFAKNIITGFGEMPNV